MNNGGDFSNKESAEINIDDTTKDGIVNTSGFSNNGKISIGKNAQIDGKGINTFSRIR